MNPRLPDVAAKPGIALSELSAYYGRQRIFADLSMAIDRGESIAILGRNGAGKTTLMRAVVGAFGVRRTGGVTIDGVDVARWPVNKIIREFRIGFVPDDRRAFPLTVLENLKLAVPGVRDWRERADQVLQYFPFLKSKVGQIATTLSGGEQQAMVVARAGMMRPAYLLLDEPCEGLSPIAVEGLINGLAELQAGFDTTLVVVDRNLDLIERLTSRAYGMETGRLVLDIPSAELVRRRDVIYDLLTPVTSERTSARERS